MRERTQLKHLLIALLKGRLLNLPINIRQAWKSLLGTKTPAYSDHFLVSKKLEFCEDSPLIGIHRTSYEPILLECNAGMYPIEAPFECSTLK
jgi:hypothetical protein